jgi:hypothetical protein
MGQSNKFAKKKERERVLIENPYDVESVFESLEIAGRYEKELIYMDRLIANLRIDSDCDLINLNFKILSDLGLITIKPKK